jgi:hypothetical protein
MPRFFIHVPGGDALSEDAKGAEFPTLEAARAQALAAARDHVVDELLNTHKIPDGEVEVRDEAGRIRATVPFREALKI